MTERLDHPDALGERNYPMSTTDMQHDMDKGEFIRLSRRDAELSHSFTAADQRERASLQMPLMKLYATLNPSSSYKWDDDFVVVMRGARRT